MNTLMKTNENISDIALAYFDEIEETLKEVSATGVYFAVAPFSFQYKRLYLIGDLLYQNNLKISATVPEGYSVKLLLGKPLNSLGDFELSTNSVEGKYQDLNTKYMNALPLEVLVTSETISQGTTSILFDIEVEERGSLSIESISCASARDYMSFSNMYPLPATTDDRSSIVFSLYKDGVKYSETFSSDDGDIMSTLNREYGEWLYFYGGEAGLDIRNQTESEVRIHIYTNSSWLNREDIFETSDTPFVIDDQNIYFCLSAYEAS